MTGFVGVLGMSLVRDLPMSNLCRYVMFHTAVLGMNIYLVIEIAVFGVNVRPVLKVAMLRLRTCIMTDLAMSDIVPRLAVSSLRMFAGDEAQCGYQGEEHPHHQRQREKKVPPVQ